MGDVILGIDFKVRQALESAQLHALSQAMAPDECFIELIQPVVGPTVDEWHRWGSLTFRGMTRAEFDEKYGRPDKDSA